MITPRRLFARTGIMLMLVGIAVGTGVLAVAFFSAAFYLALAEPLGAPVAALATGGVLITVAALLVLTVRFMVLRSDRPTRTPIQPDDQIAAAKLGEMIGEKAETWTKQHPAAAVLTALLAGFVVGSSPKLRSGLLRLLG